MDPLLVRGVAKRFVLFNLHRGLFYYDRNNKLVNHGAKSCLWSSSKELKCLLQEKSWSDGSRITAHHYFNAYKVMKEQKEESLELLKNIKNVDVIDEHTLVFKLIKENKDFKHSLSDLRWAPRPKNELFPKNTWPHFSGPYVVETLNESYAKLRRNEFYNKNKRPAVKIFFVDDPSATLNLYLTDEIDFLRYIETSNAKAYPERYLTPFARLDGLFFSPYFIEDINLRKALFHSLDFGELQKIFQSPSLPGCSSLPYFFFKKGIKCYDFDLSLSKSFLKDVKNPLPRLKVFIPSIKSNDHQRLTQWLQESWKKNLGIDVQIEQMEIGVFYKSVKEKKLPIYRKAVSLNTLTCSEAIELVKTQPEFSSFKAPKTDDCDLFFESVYKTYIRLPLGMPTFAHLHSKRYSGYYINMLGQFGLEDLESKESFQ